MAEFMKIIKEGARMCKAQPAGCDGCPLMAIDSDDFCKIFREVSSGLCRDVEKYEPLIMAWAAEHPCKTMLDVFYEHFPQAERLPNGRMRVCPYQLDPSWGGLCEDGKSSRCRECWGRPVEEG